MMIAWGRLAKSPHDGLRVVVHICRLLVSERSKWSMNNFNPGCRLIRNSVSKKVRQGKINLS